jgi:hypothetical protein
MKLPSRPALLAALMLAASGWAAAQQPPAPAVGAYRPVFAPVIDSIQVQADAALEPGSSLQFSVRGTPGGEARVRLPGPDGTDVALRETDRGVYTGNYTVRRADRIDPMGALRSSLTVGPATSVTQHWFPASIRDAQAHAAPVTPPSTIAATPLPPLGQPTPAAAPAAAAPAAAAPNVTLAPVIPYKPETQVMGAPTAPQAPLWLQVLSPGPRASVDIGDVVVRGRTLPGAEVRVQVDAVPPAPAGVTVVAQPVMQQTVRADAQGEFSFTIGPQRAPPGMRYDVLLRASDGTRSTPEQRLVLIHRG